MNTQEQALDALRKQIEEKVGRPMRSPKDFDYLADCIATQLHDTVSASTLKRLWNNMPGYASLRTSTLDTDNPYDAYHLVGHDSEIYVNESDNPGDGRCNGHIIRPVHVGL